VVKEREKFKPSRIFLDIPELEPTIAAEFAIVGPEAVITTKTV